MRFHGRLSDTSLAPMFMVFKRRVIAIYNAYQAVKNMQKPGFPWPIQHYDRIEQTPEFWVQMRIIGDDVWVAMMGADSLYFEFQTTGFPVDLGTIFGFSSYYAGVIGVTVSSTGVKAVLEGDAKSLTTTDFPPLFRSAQVQLHDEPSGYPIKSGGGYPRVLYESFAPVTSHTGIYGRAYTCGWLPFAYNTQRASGIANETRDFGYDNPWADNTGKTKVRYATLGTGTDWARASGIQTVVSATWGNREFAIYVDSFDQVSVFPTSEIGPNVGSDFLFGSDLQNVAPAVVKMQRVPFPGWVYAKTQTFKSYYASPPGDDPSGLNDFPEIDWKMHPDGTEMCAVVHERAVATLDTSYYGPYATDTGTQGPSFMYPTADSFYAMNWEAMGCYQRIGGVKASVSTDPWYLVATGVLKVQISISITGPKLSEYVLSLSVVEVRRPTTTPYCTFLAGYSWYDIKAPTWTKLEPVFDTRRGDMVALDIECYGNATMADTANLFSVKNLTQNKEINTFGGMNCVFGSGIGVGRMLTGEEAVVLAADLRTMSFAIQTGCSKFDDAPKTHESIHFGVSVIVMNKYQRTLYPNTIDPTMQVIIEDANSHDAKARMNLQMGGMALLPLNDLRTWGNVDLDSLRESYAWTSAKVGTYTPPIQPLDNFGAMQTSGYKFYRNGARLTAVPTAAAQVWYDSNMAQGGIKPFPIFDLDNPRPGWYLYMGQIIARLFQSPFTTFFSHPNGSWAFFDQQFVYNKNGMKRDGSVTGLGYNECDPANLEHCIFDFVYFAGSSKRAAQTSSFLKLYNLAAKAHVPDGTTKKNIRQLAVDYSDMRVQFEVNPIADSIDPTLLYAEIKMKWYPGFTSYFVERWYWSGIRDFGIGFESQTGGEYQLFSLGAYAQLTSGAAGSTPPMSNNNPVKFSSCVMIDP